MPKTRSTPARTIKGRENQLIAKAVNEVEKRIDNGTVSSQLLAILLKMATTKYQLEIEKIRSDTALQAAKEKEIRTKALDGQKYEEALAAFKKYRGIEDEEDYDDYDDYD